MAADEAGGSGWPSKRTTPAVGSIRRSRMRATVVFPQPDSPTRPSVSPGWMANDTSSTTRATPPRRAYSLMRPRASTSGSGAAPAWAAGPPESWGIGEMVAFLWCRAAFCGRREYFRSFFLINFGEMSHAGCNQPCGKDRPNHRGQLGDRVGGGACVRGQGREPGVDGAARRAAARAVRDDQEGRRRGRVYRGRRKRRGDGQSAWRWRRASSGGWTS